MKTVYVTESCHKLGNRIPCFCNVLCQIQTNVNVKKRIGGIKFPCYLQTLVVINWAIEYFLFNVLGQNKINFNLKKGTGGI